MTKGRRPSPTEGDPHALLASTAEAAYACDGAGRITAWNRPAESLLGIEARHAIGKRCFAVVRGADLFGNRFCSESCPLRKMIRRREAIHPYRLQIARPPKDPLQVKCSVIVSPHAQGKGYTVIHLLDPLEPARPSPAGAGDAPTRAEDSAEIPAARADPKSGAPGRDRRLTARESEVLRLVATGTSSDDIAHALGISRTTVCNHIQHILSKLEVHNKLQAVYVGLREGLF